MTMSIPHSRGMNTARPDDLEMTSLRAGDSDRTIAKMVDGDDRSERRWEVIARPRPREQPAIR
jgi:hypothetical protein